MKKFADPEIKVYPLVIKDLVTSPVDPYMNGYNDGSGDLTPEDEF